MPQKTKSSTKQELVAEIQKNVYSTVQSLTLDRRDKLPSKQAALKTFVADLDRRFLTPPFQKSDVVIVAMKVSHR